MNVVGVGYTVYLGSEYESEQMREAAQACFQAHRNGLLAVLWIYPRGAAVPKEQHPHLIAGATGLGATLGADFCKVNYPKPKDGTPAEAFKEAVKAAGRTRVITAGGGSTDVRKFLQTLHDQIFISGAYGSATGRNIHQKPPARGRPDDERDLRDHLRRPQRRRGDGGVRRQNPVRPLSERPHAKRNPHAT